MCLRPFGLYCSASLGILFVSILCMCCSHFSWYCFISFTIFCALVSSLIHWFYSLSSSDIPSRCINNLICAASKRCSSLQYPDFTSEFQCCIYLFVFIYLLKHHKLTSVIISVQEPRWSILIVEKTVRRILAGSVETLMKESLYGICSWLKELTFLLYGTKNIF
jgi:hypothetical protein